MNIDPVNATANLGVTGASPVRQERTAAPDVDEFSASSFLTRREEMVNQLMAMPEIRPSVVEHGRQLLADGSYPSDEIVEKVAEIIVSRGDVEQDNSV